MSDRAALLERIDNVAALLKAGEDEARSSALRRSETIGRPMGDAAFVDRLEGLTGRSLKPQKRGPKPKELKKGALSP